MNFNTMDLQFIPSKKGNSIAVLQGYMYVCDKRKDQSKYWKCQQFRTCKSRMKTVDGIVTATPTEHSHAPDPAKLNAKVAVTEIASKPNILMKRPAP